MPRDRAADSHWPVSLVACARKPAPPPAPAAPSFKSDIAPVLSRMCAQARGCHGEAPTDSVDLDLRPAAAWAQLVGRAAETRRTAQRVKPGDCDASRLVAKLTGRLGPREGKRMPIDPDSGAPVQPNPVDQGYLDAVLCPWIRAGAPNN